MLWLHQHKRAWRVAALALLVVALLGPWWFDRIYVPAQYACSNTVVRLEGDFCGVPMPGIFLLFILVAGSIERAIEGITGAGASLDPAEALRAALALSGIALALVLPFLTTLWLIVRENGRRLLVLHIGAWCLTAAASLLVGLMVSRPLWMAALWGSWLYVGVAAGTLVLEVGMLVGRSKESLEPTAP